MEPFNIKITSQNQPIVLTVLPTDKGYYKVIYFGAILAALKQQESNIWELIEREEMEAGDLPYYLPNAAGDRIEIILDQKFVADVGAAIEAEIAQLNQAI